MFRRRAEPPPPPPAAPGPARVLLQSGLFDQGFYEAQAGREFETPLAAARHAVSVGLPARLSPHPALDFHTQPVRVRRPWRAGKVRALLDRLADTGLPPDPGEGLRRHLMEVARAARATSVPDPTVDWALAGQGRVAGRTSVVVPTYDDAAMTGRAIRAVLATTVGHDVEVVVVDNGSAVDVAVSLARQLDDLERVRLLRLPRNLQFAGGSNLGFAASTGEAVVFLNNDTEARAGWLSPLLAALEEPDVAGAQPLLLYGDDTIQAGGTVFLRDGLLPSHLLVGLPKEDALPLAGRPFDVVTAAALALRAADVAALRGYDEGYVNGFEDVDLCLRARLLRGGRFRVVPQALVTHHESKTPGRFARAMDNRRRFLARWDGRLPPATPDLYAELGFAATVTDDGTEVPAARATVTGLLPHDPARLRWGIRVPAPAGAAGDGDPATLAADALAAELRGLGQTVVTHRAEAHGVPATALDEVAVWSAAPEPVPGRIDVVWTDTGDAAADARTLLAEVRGRG